MQSQSDAHLSISDDWSSMDYPDFNTPRQSFDYDNVLYGNVGHPATKSLPITFY